MAALQVATPVINDGRVSVTHWLVCFALYVALPLACYARLRTRPYFRRPIRGAVAGYFAAWAALVGVTVYELCVGIWFLRVFASQLSL